MEGATRNDVPGAWSCQSRDYMPHMQSLSGGSKDELDHKGEGKIHTQTRAGPKLWRRGTFEDWEEYFACTFWVELLHMGGVLQGLTKGGFSLWYTYHVLHTIGTSITPTIPTTTATTTSTDSPLYI